MARKPLTPAEQKQFIATVAPWAQAAAKLHGPPASVAIAQAILESDWGRSHLSREAHNFFGIKTARANDLFIELPTKEVIDGKTVEVRAKFRRFRSPKECFEWRAKWLATSKRYAKAMEHADDGLVYAQRIAECGYATDPGYAKKLCELMTKHHLMDFDAKGAKKNGGPR